MQAYFSTIVRQSASGDVGATRENFWLIEHLPEPLSFYIRPDCPIAKRTREWDRLRKLVNGYRTHLFSMMIDSLRQHFAKRYGPRALSVPVEIDGIDLEDYKRWVRRLARHRRVPGSPYEVGRGKPPSHAQWKPGECGRATKKPRSAPDPVDAFSKELLRSILVVKNGKEAKTTALFLTVTQLMKAAIKGNPKARTLVRKLILILKDNMLLSPPTKIKRRGMAKWRRDLQAYPHRDYLGLLVSLVIVKLMPSVKADIVSELTKRLGPADEYITPVEMSWPSRESLEARLANHPDRKVAWEYAGLKEPSADERLVNFWRAE